MSAIGRIAARTGAQIAVALVALGLSLLLTRGCAGSEPRPNVLVITLDTTRADHLGCYGYARATTPHLDALAKQSVLFEHAYANSSFTPPAHASILTSLFPSEHGLTHWSKHLAAVPTAAELFAAAGYRTAAFTPMQTLLKLGLDRGFQTTASPPYTTRGDGPIPQVVLADADAVNAAALPFLTTPDERPFFAWVHYYDAHRTYARQGPEWSGRYATHDDPSVGATEEWYQLTPSKRRALGLTPEQVTLLADHYDGGLAYLDDRVGKLIDALAAAGVLQHTLLVVVADHGEAFDEHEPEWFSHDPYLFDEVVHVPLLLRLPGGEHAGLRVPDLVQQVDVLPTLLELAGVAPPPRVSGLSLAPLLEGHHLPRAFVAGEREGDDLAPRPSGGKSPPPPPSESAVRASRDRQFMVRTETRKLVYYADRPAIGFYPVDGSAPEATDVAGSEHEAFKAAKDALTQWQAGLHEPGETGQSKGLDAEDLQRLQGMGYTGSTGAGGRPPDGPASPPKDGQ